LIDQPIWDEQAEGSQRKSSSRGKVIVAILREVLTVREVALELRGTLAHVYNVINGKVKNVPRLPSIAVGRRRLIQREMEKEQ
jgi:hypothetical protein